MFSDTGMNWFREQSSEEKASLNSDSSVWSEFPKRPGLSGPGLGVTEHDLGDAMNIKKYAK